MSSERDLGKLHRLACHPVVESSEKNLRLCIIKFWSALTMSREYRSGFPAKTGMMQLILLPPSEDNARHHSGSGGCEIQINVQGKLQRLSVTIPTTQKRAFSDNTSRGTLHCDWCMCTQALFDLIRGMILRNVTFVARFSDRYLLHCRKNTANLSKAIALQRWVSILKKNDLSLLNSAIEYSWLGYYMACNLKISSFLVLTVVAG